MSPHPSSLSFLDEGQAPDFTGLASNVRPIDPDFKKLARPIGFLSSGMRTKGTKEAKYSIQGQHFSQMIIQMPDKSSYSGAL